MGPFLEVVGVLMIIGSIFISLMIGAYWFLVFPIIFILGALSVGLGHVINLLEEIKNKNNIEA